MAMIGRWGCVGEILIYSCGWSGRYHRFALVTRESAKTIHLVELEDEDVHVHEGVGPGHPADSAD
jgi:hypothetical protein